MRNINVNCLSAGDSLSTNGSTLDSNQWVSASFQAYFGDSNAAGTFKLQASNDTFNDRPGFSGSGFQPTHWVDIPNQSSSITSGASALLTVANMCYRWIRAVYSSTATGIQTIGVLGDTASSLQSKYFLLNSANGGVGYYVWFNVSSGGVDPAIAGRTGVPVAISAGANASTVGTALASAIDALTEFTASGTTTVTVTNSASGPFTPITDGTAATHFTFAITAGGTTTVNVVANALSM